jgi:hypothetical protein
VTAESIDRSDGGERTYRSSSTATNGRDRPAQPARGFEAWLNLGMVQDEDRYSSRKGGRLYRPSIADKSGCASIEPKRIPELVIVIS